MSSRNSKHPALSLAVKWLAILFCFSPIDAAYAHAFGQRFDLPIPLDYYLSGAAAAVLLSFVLVAWFAKVVVNGDSKTKCLHRFQFLDTNRSLAVLRIFFLGIFFLTIAAGLLGNQDPKQNLMPTMLWIIWWTGMAFLCALVGNLWALINPWQNFFCLMEKSYLWIRPAARGFSLDIRYPSWLGVWPACLLFGLFVWGELIWPANAVPANLSLAVIGYSLITWLGMFVFGCKIWLHNGEVFTLVFGLLGRFAPLGVQTQEKSRHNTTSRMKDIGAPAYSSRPNCMDQNGALTMHQWEIRPFGVGLLANSGTSVSLMFFVLLMLSTVTFDGFMGTPVWVNIQETLPDWRPLQPFLFRMEMWGFSRELVIATLGLLLFPFFFGGVYLVFAWLMKCAAPIPAGSRSVTNVAHELSTIATGAYFVFTLVPIALAYHLAHYISFLLTVGQLIIPLVSDPFGQQWDLFGTASYKIDISVIDARFVWNTSVIAIVIGHMIAVWLGHTIALRSLNSRRKAIVNQLPMLILMIFYTTFSLWILSQPLID